MRTMVAIAAAILIMPIVACVGAQDIEAVAVHALLQRGNIPTDRERVIEARIPKSGHAPPVFARTRDSAGTAVLARALNAKGGLVGQVHSSGVSYSAKQVVLSLPEPTVVGDVATITVTGTYRGKRGNSEYATVAFTLRRRGNAWVVVKSEQLGVS